MSVHVLQVKQHTILSNNTLLKVSELQEIDTIAFINGL